ncbi:Salicylate hydroxylase [Fusarium austroafricanum]|uniref:Salicylate hydroxylase n=1 Tax=Fusarium austroafricanum TaxID=2364996 RepID=A0A8H4KPJ8_9HYPO|nr:Salicylate hydroxylase [Fusarium austroafricanum]
MDNKSLQHHFLEGKTIIVAGGGVAGSAFAVGLRKLWNPQLKEPKIIIYDRDSPDVTAQREGYTLSLTGYDTSGGLLPLKRLGLLGQILDKAVSGLNGEGAFKIWGPDWQEIASFRHEPIGGLPSGSVRIARRDLRQVLHDNFGPQDSVKWNSRCISARQLEQGRLRVQVANGQGGHEVITEEDCDLLIAADGANSKLRGYLRPNDSLEFAGAILRGGIARFDGPLPAPVDKDWGFMLSGTGVSCFFSPVDRNSVVWGVGNLETEQVATLDYKKEEMIQEVIDRGLELGARLQEPFKTIVNRTDPKTVFAINAKDKKPFVHEDIEQTGVVFIGDSNHAVTPFAGCGANLALCDAWDLAEQLCKSNSIKEGISAYDRLSEPRARNILERAREKLKAGHKAR